MERVGLYEEHAEQYDRIYSRKDYAGEARWLTSLARRSTPSARTLLDVACGTGRHLELFRRSFSVAGVDASGAMLRIARRRLGTSVRLTRGDMRSFDLGREFDVVVCLFSAIGYLLSGSDRRRAFRSFYRHLAPGGVAIVEGWILPSTFRDRSAHLQVYDGAEAKIARVSTVSRTGATSRIEMQYLLGVPGGGVEHWREVHRNALVEPAEMLRTMRDAGFRARFLRTGPFRDRGVYVGIRPADRSSPGVRPSGARRARASSKRPRSDRPRL
jgi:SAM-dependent methyltransferase